MLFTIIPSFTASPVMAQERQALFTHSVHFLDWGDRGTSIVPMQGNNQLVIDSRAMGANGIPNNAGRHRFFVLVFDLSDFRNEMNYLDEIVLSLFTSGDGGANTANSQFNVYLMSAEHAEELSQGRISTLGEALDAGVVSYRENIVWNQVGSVPHTRLNSPDLLPYIEDYMAANPLARFVALKAQGTNHLAAFYPAVASGFCSQGFSHRPHLQITAGTELWQVIESNEILASMIPSVTYSNITLPTGLSQVPAMNISWSSSRPDLIANDGTVTRPVFHDNTTTVRLEATVTLGTVIRTFAYYVRVLREGSYLGTTPFVATREISISFDNISSHAGYVLRIPSSYLARGNNYRLLSATGELISTFPMSTMGDFTDVNVSDFVSGTSANFTLEAINGTFRQSDETFILDGIDNELRNIINALNAIDLGDTSAIVSDMTLPSESQGVQIIWRSLNPEFLSDTGRVDRPFSWQPNANVQLAAVGQVGGFTFQHIFAITILRQDGGQVFPEILDPMHISDEAFFGVWNQAHQGWSVTPILRYDLKPGLRHVEAAVRRGDYPAAREALLIYYRNRDTVREFRPRNRHNPLAADMYVQQIHGWVQVDEPLAQAVIGPEWGWHSIDLVVRDNMSNSVMILDSDMDGSAVEIRSREFGNGQYAAYIEIVADGVRRTFPVVGDTFISAGDNIQRNFGSEEILLVREAAGNPTTTITNNFPGGIPMPFGTNTARTYLLFDIPNAVGNVTSMQLNIFARSDNQDDKRVFLFSTGHVQTFNENTFVWGDHTPNIINHKEIGFVYEAAINGLWGGHFEFLNSITRMYPLGPLIDRYHETGDEIFAWTAMHFMMEQFRQQPQPHFPRPLEAGWRTEWLCVLFFGTLESELMTPEIATAMLKYIHLHVGNIHPSLPGVGIGAAFNQVMAQLTGAIRIMAYFPEIQTLGGWNQAKTSQVNLFNRQINIDGSYTEGTTGYINLVLIELQRVLELISMVDGMEDPHYRTLFEYFVTLTRYMFNLTMNSGYTVPWGSGHRFPNFERANVHSIEFPAVDPLGFYQYVYSGGARGTRPYWTSIHYPDKSVAMLRSGWGPYDYSAFMGSKFGGTHSHGDDLSLDIFAYGRSLLIEAGQGFSSTFHHNTVEINRRNQRGFDFGVLNVNQPQKQFLSTNSLFDFMEAGSRNLFPRFEDPGGNWHTGFEVNRKVLFVHNRFWIVSDFILPDDYNNPNHPERTPAPHLYRQIWRPDQRNNLTIDPDTLIMRTNFASGANLQIIPADPDELTAVREVGDMRGHYGIEAAPFVSYMREAHVGPATFDTILFPEREGEQTAVSVSRLAVTDVATPEVYVPRHEATALRINIGFNTGFYYSSNDWQAGFPVPRVDPPGGQRLVRPTWNGQPGPPWNGMPEWQAAGLLRTRSFDEFTTDAEMAYVEVNGQGNPVMIALTKASFIDRDGTPLVTSDDRLPDLGIQWSARTLELSVDVLDFNTRQFPEGLIAVWEPPLRHNLLGNGVEIDSRHQAIDRVYLNGRRIQFTQVNGIISTNGTPFSGDDGDIIERPPPQGPPDNIPQGPTNPSAPPSGPSAPSGPGGPVGPIGPTDPGNGNDVNNNVFNDIANHWARDEILEMYAQGVVNGVGNGQFAPNYNITRAQFAAILVRALGIPLNAESNNGDIFTDVNGTDWFASAVAAAYNVGLIRGYNGYFRPNDEVSRQEMAIMLMTALEYMGFENDNYADLSSFNDASSIADWAYNATSGAVGAGLMSGIGNGEFSPRTSATRAQATVVISRLLDLRD